MRTLGPRAAARSGLSLGQVRVSGQRQPRRPAAIDRLDLARHEGRVIRGKPGDQRRDFLGRSGAPEGRGRAGAALAGARVGQANGLLFEEKRPGPQ